jgi:hypothetical protein
MPGSTGVQWGVVAAQRALGKATLHPAGDNEQQIEFSSPAWDALWLAMGAAAFSPGAIYARSPTWRLVVGGAVLLLVTVAVQRACWRERLTLDLMQRRYRYSHGYWPRLTTDEGSLEAVKGVQLDVVVESGSRGGEIDTWVVSLALDGRTLPVANFSNELAGYEYLGALAKRLRVPALDHTGRNEQKTEWREVDKPLAAQSGGSAARRQIPPLPDGARIALLGDAPERRIVLPRPGFRPSYFLFALFPLFPAWFTGTPHNLGMSAPFIAFAGLFALIGAIACVTNKEVIESGDSIAFATRLFGASLGTQTLAKRDIVDVRVKPVPARNRSTRDELQVRAAARLVNFRVARLSGEEMAWLAQAVSAMVAAG